MHRCFSVRAKERAAMTDLEHCNNRVTGHKRTSMRRQVSVHRLSACIFFSIAPHPLRLVNNMLLFLTTKSLKYLLQIEGL